MGIPPQVTTAAAQASKTLAQRLAEIAAEAAVAGEAVLDASATVAGAEAIVGAGIVFALPSELFGASNIGSQSIENAAIDKAQQQIAPTLAAKGIVISGSAAVKQSPSAPITTPTPATILPAVPATAKNQVASAPQVLHGKTNPFSYPTAQTIIVPPRRLAPTSNQQSTATPTPMQQVHRGSSGRTYGELLHSPKGDFYHLDYKFDTTKWNADFIQGQAASASVFSEWVKGKSVPSLLETGLLFIDIPNTAPAGTTPKESTVPLFGVGISHLMNQYGSRGKIANQMPTHGLIPLGVLGTVVPLGLAGPLSLGSLGTLRGRAVNTLSRIRPANILSNAPQQFEKIKAALLNSWVLEFLTFCMAMHNASMLSLDVIQSCTQVVDNILTIFSLNDLTKDADGNNVGVATKLETKLEDLIKYAIGRNQYVQIKEKWKIYSAIYTAGANIVNTIGTMQQATRDILQVTGSYVGKIGNALNNSGVVGDLEWMTEAITARSARYAKFNSVLDEAQQFSGDIAIVTSAALSAKQAKDELNTQAVDFKQAIDNATGKKTKEGALNDVQSTPPSISQADER